MSRVVMYADERESPAFLSSSSFQLTDILI